MSTRKPRDPIATMTLVLGEGFAMMLLAPAEYLGAVYVGFPPVTAWGVTGLVYMLTIAAIRVGRLIAFAFAMVWASGLAGVIHQAQERAALDGQPLDRFRVVLTVFVVTLIVTAMVGLWWLSRWLHARADAAAATEAQRLQAEERERREARETAEQRRQEHALAAVAQRAQIEAQKRADEEAQRAAEHERSLAALRAQTEAQSAARETRRRPQPSAQKAPQTARASATPAPQSAPADPPQSDDDLHRRAAAKSAAMDALRRGEKVDPGEFAARYYGTAEPTEKQRNAARANLSTWGKQVQVEASVDDRAAVSE